MDPASGATANVMMAATLAQGTTVIRGAACEPHISDLARFLNAMGADIEGIGTSVLTIRGVKQLRGTEHTVISDDIEAGTLLLPVLLPEAMFTLKGLRRNKFLLFRRRLLRQALN